MSVLRDLAVFLISGLFTFSLFTTLTSYTLGEYLQKESLREFIESSLDPSLIEQGCEEECSKKIEGITDELKEICTEQCIIEAENKLEENLNNEINRIYEERVLGYSINEAISLLNQFTLFAILTIVSAGSILFLSEEPLSYLGKDLITISMFSFLIAEFLPNLVMLLSNISIDGVISSYMGQGLEQLKTISIIFIIIGIVLIITNYFLKRKKEKTVNK
jgi:hypothetical protein